VRKRPRFSLVLLASLTLGACEGPLITPQRSAGPGGPRLAAEGENDLFRSVTNADAANVGWSTTSGERNVSGFLFVGRNRAGQNTETTLFYNIAECDAFFFCTTIESGFGFIPSTDLKGNAGSKLTLKTNTSAAANPDFIRFIGSGGQITLEFRITPEVQTMFTSGGTSYSKFLDNTFRFNFGGTFRSSSADAVGTVIGFAVPLDSFAGMGEDHRASIFVSSNR
jgi:hypothetical protein